MPAAGVRLPSGSRLEGGTLSANLSISGPSTAPTITGPLEVDNTRLAGFDLASKIGGLKPVAGSQGGTEIQKVFANVTSSAQGTRIENLYAAIPLLGTATGAGTIAPGGALNFELLAKLNTSSGAGGQPLAGLNTGGGVLGQALSTAVANGIPVHITGTTSNPVIQADLSKLLQRECRQYFEAATFGQWQQQSQPGRRAQQALSSLEVCDAKA